MQKSAHIQQELNDLGVSLPVSSMPDMSIPADYFQQLSTNIYSEIQQESLLNSLPKEMPYAIPANFFEHFNTQIRSAIASDEAQINVSHEMPYHVPENYFTNLPTEIFARLQSSKKPIRLYTFSQKWIAKLSLAATLLLFMGIAFKGLMPATSTKPISLAEQQLGSVSDAEINQYLQEHESEISTGLVLESIDPNTIDLKLLETEIFDKSLNNISDEELLKYQL